MSDNSNKGQMLLDIAELKRQIERRDARILELERQALVDGEAVAWLTRAKGSDGEFGCVLDKWSADNLRERGHTEVIPLYTHPLPAAGGVDPAAAYDAGFRRASDWARRDDLLHDMESTAYVRDREYDFAMMGHPATSPKPAEGGAADATLLDEIKAFCATASHTQDAACALLVRAANALTHPAPARDVAEGIALAYGLLWHVNAGMDAPGIVPSMTPEKAAHEARKALRDLMTKEQRGDGINAARDSMKALATDKEQTK